MSAFVLRLVILLVGVHCYIFLSALIYHYLEHPSKVDSVNHLERVVDRLLISSSGPSINREDVIGEIKAAWDKDNANKIQKAFKSLSKCYLFSLTTITTLGNSGLYLQSDGSRLFFIFTTTIGIILYVSLVHHLGIALFTVFKGSVEFSIRQHFDERHIVQYKSFSRLAILLFSYLITFCSFLIMGLAALISGHGYLFGLYVIFDSALSVGNFSILAFVYPWNEIGYVLSVNLVILMALSISYTSVYLTFQYASGSDFDELIKYWWNSKDSEHDYEMVSQAEERPFKKFMAQSKQNEATVYKVVKSDTAPLDMKGKEHERNPFLSDGGNPFQSDVEDDDDVIEKDTEHDTESVSGRGPDSLTPAFLSMAPEHEEGASESSKEEEGNVAK